MKKISLLYCFSLLFFSAYAQNKAGEISATAKYIDADELGPFNQGAAIIRKGTATAMIDTAGNFIIPFNASHLSYSDIRNNNGIFCMSKTPTSKLGDYVDYRSVTKYINSKGKTILEGSSKVTLSPDDGKCLVISEVGEKKTYIYPDGTRFSFQPKDNFTSTLGWYEGRAVLYEMKKEKKYQYITTENKALAGGSYDQAEHFSEGCAVVGKKDSYGVMKYGFISRDGQPVTPLQFSIKPDEFKANLTKIYPQDQSEFESAVINKKGEIIYKQTPANLKAFGSLKAFVENTGYFENGKSLLLANGKVIATLDLLGGLDKGLTTKYKPSSLVADIIKTQQNAGSKVMVFRKTGALSGQEASTIGFVNLGNGKLIDAAFAMPQTDDTPEHQLVFDSLSNLAYARLYAAFNKQKGWWDYTEGYINKAGIFVIVVKKEKAVW